MTNSTQPWWPVVLFFGAVGGGFLLHDFLLIFLVGARGCFKFLHGGAGLCG
jgi:hypothetical protein